MPQLSKDKLDEGMRFRQGHEDALWWGLRYQELNLYRRLRPVFPVHEGMFLRRNLSRAGQVEFVHSQRTAIENPQLPTVLPPDLKGSLKSSPPTLLKASHTDFFIAQIRTKWSIVETCHGDRVRTQDEFSTPYMYAYQQQSPLTSW